MTRAGPSCWSSRASSPALGCRKPPPPRNLLLVTFDTTRADHLGCYGRPNARTRTLDGLAARGVLFEQCRSAAPITMPSHSTMMTGLYPPAHGVRDNGMFRAAREPHDPGRDPQGPRLRHRRRHRVLRPRPALRAQPGLRPLRGPAWRGVREPLGRARGGEEHALLRRAPRGARQRGHPALAQAEPRQAVLPLGALLGPPPAPHPAAPPTARSSPTDLYQGEIATRTRRWGSCSRELEAGGVASGRWW